MTPTRRTFLGAVGGAFAVSALAGPSSGEVTVTADPDVAEALRDLDVDPDRPAAELFREADDGIDASIAALLRTARETESETEASA